MKPSTRLDLLGRRCASIAVSSSKVSPQSLYVGFRALVQMNSDSVLSSSSMKGRGQRHSSRGRSRRGDNNDFPAAIFEHLSSQLQQQPRSVPARNIAPCLFAVAHGLTPSSRVRALDWEVLQSRLVPELLLMRSPPSSPRASMTADDTVSLLHSLSMHGRISSPALRAELFKRLTHVLRDVTRGQLLSVIYSVSALGMGVADSGAVGDDRARADEHATAVALFVAELQSQLAARAATFSLGEIARLLSKVSVAVPLSARQKKELCAPFLDQAAKLLRQQQGSTTRGAALDRTLSEYPVLLLALARVRLFRHEAFAKALDTVVAAPATALTARQKVLVLFAIHTAGASDILSGTNTREESLTEWFLETACAAAPSIEAIQEELRTNRWDNVTLSYFSVSAACALELLGKDSRSDPQTKRRRREHLAAMRDFAAARLASSSTRKGAAPPSLMSAASSAVNEEEPKSRDVAAAADHSATNAADTGGAGGALAALMAAIKVAQQSSSSSATAGTSLEQVSRILEQPMSSYERVTVFITFAQRNVFSNNNSAGGGGFGSSTTAIIDKQVQLICRNVRFSTVPTSTIVAYLRVLGRLRLSGNTAPYVSALTVILGEQVGGNASSASESSRRNADHQQHSGAASPFAMFLARHQPPRHPSDLPDQEESAAGRPRTLLPAEAATVVIVMARASMGARRFHQIMRLCHIVARRIDDVSVSLRLGVLHSLGELRCPDRHYTDVLTQSMADAATQRDESNVSSSSSSSSMGISTRSDAALALIGSAYAYSVHATQGLSQAAMAYLEKIYDGSSGPAGKRRGQVEVISRSRMIQLPVAIAHVGGYPSAVSECASSSSSSSFIEKVALDAVSALDRANLPESWNTLLYWRHSIAPLLRPEVRERCENSLKNFVQLKMEPILRQQQQQQQQQQNRKSYHQHHAGGGGSLSVLYQLACGLEFLWPVHAGNTCGSSSSSNVLKESPARLLWLPLVSRLRGAPPDISRHPELVLPAGMCLVRVLRAAATPRNETDKEMKSLLSPEELRRLSLDIHASLENSIRFVSRSDDLALLLLALRQLAFDAAEAAMMMTEDEEGVDGAETESSAMGGDAGRYYRHHHHHHHHGEASNTTSLKSWIENVCCDQIIVPLMKTIATALYIRETAPPILSSKNAALDSSFAAAAAAATAGFALDASSSLVPPTSQLSCVGLRLVCESLSEGVLFDGEAETFEIAANAVNLSAQRLEHCLSVWDAAASLRGLMAMATAPVVAHTPVTFTTMDTLSTVVRGKAGTAMEQHRSLCTSVLPGIGAIGGSGSLLSL